MSTLEYLDPNRAVNFTFVPWTLLNEWLSALNGSTYEAGKLRDGVNRGKVIEELESRMKKKTNEVLAKSMHLFGRDRGHGMDWREYENAHSLGRTPRLPADCLAEASA